jgi:plasmid stabilization system protein ParE
VADLHARVEHTASFIERLESIEAFLTDAGAPQAYDKLLDGLRRTVIPNLRRFPRIGRRYLGAADALREYLHGDHLLLCTQTGATVYLLSIRHHRQLSFAFAKLWEP